MTAFGPSVSQSVAGVQQAAAHRLRASEKERQSEKARDRSKRQDEVELSVDQVELAEAVRNLKGNEEEEAHEDRKQQAPPGPLPGGRHIDLEG